MLMGLQGPEEFMSHLKSGRRCFLATRDEPGKEEIIAYGWVSQKREYVGELERTFRLRDREVYIWDCVTMPDYRGLRLYSALLSFMLVTLRAEGVPRAWIGAGVANRPSVQGIVNAGFQPVLTLVYRRILGLHYIWIVYAPGVPRHVMSAARRLILTGRELQFGPLVVGASRG